jgi:putative transposase
MGSAAWIHGRFQWQEEFGAFSCAHSQLTSVLRYIQNQERHHARRTFREEYSEMLRKFEVAYDERYIFKPLE